MDIGQPYRDLGPVENLDALIAHLETLTEDDWTQNTFRQEVLAAKPHRATKNIIFKHEWHPYVNPWRLRRMEDLIEIWAKEKGLDTSSLAPISREDTDMGFVYTFPEWDDFKDVIEPVVQSAIDPVRTKNGIVMRLALVHLPGKEGIATHTDGQPLARVAHRLHVPLSGGRAVHYKIAGKKFIMKQGHVYDFNNCVKHSVLNKGSEGRTNLFIDYYPDPPLFFSNPLRPV